MKFLIALALVGLATNTIGYKYDTQLVLEVLSNPRMVGAFADCLLEIGSCTREGIELKNKMSELIDTSCGKCTEQDKKFAAQVILLLKNKFPQKYEALLNKYDPEGKRRAELDEFLKKYGS